jgi:S-methylmethionine-dependent homocysteine/selenocysteine methylase
MIILDGSMGNELLKRTNKPSSGLWSAQFLIDSPNLVKEVHQAYVDVGAQVITTNTYSTIPSYLQKENKTHLMKDLIRKAGALARQVADGNNQEILIAGGLPPLDESYRPDLVPNEEDSIPIYEELIDELNSFVDIFLCETVSSIAETSNVLKALKNKAREDKKIWLSWTLLEDKSGRLRSKETIEDAFQFAESFNPDAYLFNCTDPIAITEGIKKLSKLTDKQIGCYPNVFGVPFDWTLDNNVEVDPRNLSIEQFIKYKNLWNELGASIIGGCCGLGPDYIKAIA